MHSHELLKKLISFDTTSALSNLELVAFVQDYLAQYGVDSQLVHDETGGKANLYATIGPQDKPGVMLSGHTDVVPVKGQNWSSDPFVLTERDERLYGRGSCDMKGFIGVAMAQAQRLGSMTLREPVHLALSYDEEVGCVGVRSLIDMLAAAPFTPQFCIVGEPTEMQVATGHKGKTAGRITTTGRAGHSALAPDALNAIHMACDMITVLRDLQDQIAESGAQNLAYDVPYTTLHVGRIEGGIALNIVPDHTTFEFEIRNLAEDDPQALLNQINARRDQYLETLQTRFPEAQIAIQITNSYPPLGTPSNAPVVSFVQGLTGSRTTFKVAFGTEGGLFSSRLNVPTVVCGPGSMAQGHKADEFVTIGQVHACDTMMETLLTRLEEGL